MRPPDKKACRKSLATQWDSAFASLSPFLHFYSFSTLASVHWFCVRVRSCACACVCICVCAHVCAVVGDLLLHWVVQFEEDLEEARRMETGTWNASPKVVYTHSQTYLMEQDRGASTMQMNVYLKKSFWVVSVPAPTQFHSSLEDTSRPPAHPEDELLNTFSSVVS